ncbi:hypothetical protein D3C81_1687050 [compost metagenome]
MVGYDRHVQVVRIMRLQVGENFLHRILIRRRLLSPVLDETIETIEKLPDGYVILFKSIKVPDVTDIGVRP